MTHAMQKRHTLLPITTKASVDKEYCHPKTVRVATGVKATELASTAAEEKRGKE